MKIGILGGQFNPPHFGHLIMAQEVLHFTKTDQVWLTPCFQHTFDKTMASVHHRAQMTKLMALGKIKYCDEEIKNKLSGETIELMDLLSKTYPQHQFSFIIGSDNLPTFKKWGQWEALVKKYLFWIVPRPGFDLDLKKYGLDNPGYQFKIINHPLLAVTNISATMIRERLAKGLSIKNLIPQNIYLYIKRYQLYG